MACFICAWIKWHLALNSAITSLSEFSWILQLPLSLVLEKSDVLSTNISHVDIIPGIVPECNFDNNSWFAAAKYEGVYLTLTAYIFLSK